MPSNHEQPSAKSNKLRSVKKVSAALAIVVSGAALAACGGGSNSADSKQGQTITTTTPGTKTKTPETTTTPPTASKNVTPIVDLCNVPAINSLISRELNIQPKNLTCVSTPGNGYEADVTWGDATLQNEDYPPSANVTIQPEATVNGRTYFANQQYLESQSAYQAAPYDMEDLPNIDGQPAIWVGGSNGLEADYKNYFVQVTDGDPTSAQSIKPIAVDITASVMENGFQVG